VAKGTKIPGKEGRVFLDRKGMGDLLRSRAILAELRKRMTRVQAALPGSTMYTTNTSRARVVVARGSDFDEANTGDLARALDLAGGQRGYKVKSRKPVARKSRV
jgi:hypothetical protein